MNRDLVMFGVAVPVVAVIVLCVNKGKPVTVAPANSKLAASAAGSHVDWKNAADATCTEIKGKDKKYVLAKLGQPQSKKNGAFLYMVGASNTQPLDAISVTFNKKNKVASAHVVHLPH